VRSAGKNGRQDPRYVESTGTPYIPELSGFFAISLKILFIVAPFQLRPSDGSWDPSLTCQGCMGDDNGGREQKWLLRLFQFL
jgi:hypothetical protein